MDFTHATIVLECSDDVIHLLLCIVVRGIANERGKGGQMSRLSARVLRVQTSCGLRRSGD